MAKSNPKPKKTPPDAAGAKAPRPKKTLPAAGEQVAERNRQIGMLDKLRALLQTCSSVEEMSAAISHNAARLFPGTDGALFLLKNSATGLQAAASWGAFPQDENSFKSDECWGLRLGRIHVVADVKNGPVCPHIKHAPPSGFLCMPLTEKGDILGALHLRLKPATKGGQSIADLKEAATVFGMLLSLSLANLKLQGRLTEQSARDSLTGLFNRRYMEEALQSEIIRASRKRTQIGLIMADIDYFKKFNDLYGREAGDVLIVKLAELFMRNIRGSDIACRYGGEEFVFILPETSADDTIKRAEALRQEAKNLNVFFQQQLLCHVTISMGIAVYPDSGAEAKDLLSVADKALYKAKKSGRDRVVSG